MLPGTRYKVKVKCRPRFSVVWSDESSMYAMTDYTGIIVFILLELLYIEQMCLEQYLIFSYCTAVGEYGCYLEIILGSFELATKYVLLNSA